MGQRSFYVTLVHGLSDENGEQIYHITSWNAEHTSCGVCSVPESRLEANRKACIEGGSFDATNMRWDFAKREYVPL